MTESDSHCRGQRNCVASKQCLQVKFARGAHNWSCCRLRSGFWTSPGCHLLHPPLAQAQGSQNERCQLWFHVWPKFSSVVTRRRSQRVTFSPTPQKRLGQDSTIGAPRWPRPRATRTAQHARNTHWTWWERIPPSGSIGQAGIFLFTEIFSLLPVQIDAQHLKPVMLTFWRPFWRGEILLDDGYAKSSLIQYELAGPSNLVTTHYYCNEILIWKHC